MDRQPVSQQCLHWHGVGSAHSDRTLLHIRSDPWFSGPWFVRPDEVEHVPTKMFYRNEVFMSSIQDTNPMRSVIGRCAVLVPKDFVKCTYIVLLSLGLECFSDWEWCHPSCQPFCPPSYPPPVSHFVSHVVIRCCLVYYVVIGHVMYSLLSGRPTEVFEDDVFVCERKYNESEKEIKKIRTLKVQCLL